MQLQLKCVFCHTPSKQAMALCKDCEEVLPFLPQTRCVQCALPLKSQHSGICGVCQNNPTYYDKTISVFSYDRPISQLMIDTKFNSKLIYINLLGKLLAQSITEYYQTPLPELMIPIPLHKKRLRERGFNQSLEIAKIIKKSINLPINFKCVSRIKNTQPQSKTRANLRQKNIKHAFRVNDFNLPKHIAIVDDIMTTGSTVNELSRILKTSGVEQIDIWCCVKSCDSLLHKMEFQLKNPV